MDGGDGKDFPDFLKDSHFTVRNFFEAFHPNS
jgi:hypothetical protein